MGTIDVLAVDISIQLLVILLETSKSLLTEEYPGDHPKLPAATKYSKC